MKFVDYLIRALRPARCLVAIAMLLAAFSAQKSSAQDYCQPTYYYYYMGFDYIGMGDINNYTNWSSGGYWDYTYMSTTVTAGSKVDISMTLNAGITYPMTICIYVDYNHDGDFSESGEKVYSMADYDYSTSRKMSFNVPASAELGATRIRFMCAYYYDGYNSVPSDPCGVYGYGECEDYTIDIQPPPADASISKISGPGEPIREGSYPVSCTLSSNVDVPVESAMINWSVNDIFQGSTYWSGYLAQSQTEEVNLGNVDFFYPADEYYFRPFQLKVWVSDVNGKANDRDPKNDMLLATFAAVTDDAGISSVNVPTGPFDPSSTQKITATIKNFAPKKLTSAIVHWSLDGVNQKDIPVTGIKVPANGEYVVDLGLLKFPLKNPVAEYEIAAWTTLPNDNDDQGTENDRSSSTVGAALVPGTYKIGGMNNQFASMTAAANYMNAKGVSGDGNMEFVIDKGYYGGPIELNNFAHGNNNFLIRSRYGKPEDVTISFAAESSMAVLYVNNIPNLTFKDITLSATSGKAVWAENADNLTITNCNLNASTYAGEGSLPENVYLSNCNHATVSKNKFNGGSEALNFVYDNGYEPGKVKPVISSSNTTSFYVTGNSFTEFANGGVSYYKPAPSTGDAFVVSGNSFMNMSSITAYFGVMANDGGQITDNTFTGFAGSGSTDGVINLSGMANQSFIKNNRIGGARDINGIMTSGSDVKVYHNSIEVSDLSEGRNAGMQFTNTSGYVGNNMIMGTGAGVTMTDCMGLDFLYNTVVNSSNDPTIIIADGNASVRRNILMNRLGVVSEISGSTSGTGASTQSSENNIYSLSDPDGNELNLWKVYTSDVGSIGKNIAFEGDKDLRIALYDDAYLFYTPLNLPSDIQAEVQRYDWENEERAGYYYLGADGIILKINISAEPESIVDCIGSPNQMLFVSATMNYGCMPKYQWSKDGVDIPGATDTKLNLDTLQYSLSGVYACHVWGPGNTLAGVNSAEAAVYALYPTTITKEPENINANNNDNVTFSVEAHMKGIVPPFYQHNFQWYRQKAGKTIMLADDNRYSGTKSANFSIRAAQASDFNDDADVNDYYFVIVKGLCGSDTSSRVVLRQGPGINITKDPSDLEICQGEPMSVSAAAQITGKGVSLSYQWKLNGNTLQNSKNVSGADADLLEVKEAELWMAGKYTCEVTVQPGDIKKTTQPATISIIELPRVVSTSGANATAIEGDAVTLSVKAAGGDKLSYEWYFNGELITGGLDSPDYTIGSTVVENSGKYTCKVSNKCGEVMSSDINLTVSPKTISGIDDPAATGGILVAPNPVSGMAEVRFAGNEAGKARLTLMDAAGRQLAVLFDGTTTLGINTIKMDSGALGLASGVYFLRLEQNGTSRIGVVAVAK